MSEAVPAPIPAANPADDEEALSRAAREAVRQPADPRIERSFAHLGEPPSADSRAATPAASPAGASVDVGALVEAVERAQAAVDRATQRLETATRVVIGLAAVIVALLVFLAVRAAI